MLVTMRMLAVLIVAPSLLAQAVSAGLRVGIPITPAVTASGIQQASTSRYTAGPAIEVELWRGAALAGDFLLERSHVSSPAASQRAEIWRWVAPVSLVYRFRGPLRPIARTGVSLNRVFHI